MAHPKASILLVGGGAVGTIAAVNIEAGGLGEVTLVARSNYQQIKEDGFEINSVDHGELHRWRPTNGAYIRKIYRRCLNSLHNSYSLLSHQVVIKVVPSVSSMPFPGFDYVVCATKNCPDIKPSLPDIIVHQSYLAALSLF
jgi:ketopantoate reductase